MVRVRLALLVFVGFLGLVIYAADTGLGPTYWGWLRQVPMGDKLCHCGFMFTFSVLSNLALGCRGVGTDSRRLLLGTLLVSLLVAAEETSQIWIPGRDFDLLDLTADLVGIVAGDVAARKLLPALLANATAEAGEIA